MIETTHKSLAERRADVDHLRVGALLLLIVYHVLLVFDTGDWWRVKSEHAGVWADFIIGALTPWRMALVFFIGGIAARFMFEKQSSGGFVRDRALKLLTAFVFAIIVLAPMQRFVRLDAHAADAGNYLNYLVFHAPFAVSYHGIWLPDFAHAWFLPYLFAYSVGAVAFWRFASRHYLQVQRVLERTPVGLIIAAVMAWFAVIEIFVAPAHPVSGIIFTDITAHLKFAPIFLFGTFVAKSCVFRSNLVDSRWVLWPLALALLTLSLYLQGVTPPHLGVLPPAEMLATRGLYGGAMLFAVAAFGEWALNRPSAALTYATDAILPVYLMHQTVLVIVADQIVFHHWPLATELAVLFASASLIPLFIYHVVVRHTPWLRVLFGLRPAAPTRAPQALDPTQELAKA
ncbi:MAG: acyltransferase family protein [Terricaulis sp.]